MATVNSLFTYRILKARVVFWEMDFESWKNVHQQQLNEIPELYWESLFTKLCTEVSLAY